jgi:hypothetical protein
LTSVCGHEGHFQAFSVCDERRREVDRVERPNRESCHLVSCFLENLGANRDLLPSRLVGGDTPLHSAKRSACQSSFASPAMERRANLETEERRR